MRPYSLPGARQIDRSGTQPRAEHATDRSNRMFTGEGIGTLDIGALSRPRPALQGRSSAAILGWA